MKATASSSSRASKRRRRRPPSHYSSNHTSETAAEERLLQQAIQNSKLDKARPADLPQLPRGPVFYATQKDFEGNPLDYIERIRPQAEPWGICKIVPPPGWNPAPFCVRDEQKDGAKEEEKKRFQTKLQVLHRLQEGISYGDGVEYTVSEYLKTSARRTQEWKAKYYPDHDLLSRHATALEQQQQEQTQQESGNKMGGKNNNNHHHHVHNKRFLPENLERDYWEIVETHTRQVTVEYGNDVDTADFGSAFPLSRRGRSVHQPENNDKEGAGEVRPVTPNSDDGDSNDVAEESSSEEFSRDSAASAGGAEEKMGDDQKEPDFGTPEYYRETFWNLNNMPNAPGSILRHIRVGINGINVPWMYYGSLWTTFAYHNEDNYLYSINYHHRGAPKQWYGVPGDHDAADGLEKVFKSYLSMKMRDVPDLLHHITTMFSPRLLQNAQVPVCKLVQYEGEYVVTFPRAFHGGFSYGPNAGEAVNFASHDWIQYGADANERYRSFARPAVFSQDRLTLTMANHLKDQTSSASCKLLLKELERVVEEEIESRERLADNGVRDVSKMIDLPKNRVDQLDEKSAAYDDKRLCHACKHVCFFSAVACECSQSKVSCLRHSHFMCRCPPEKKYFMIWSPREELESTLENVRLHCKKLEEQEGISGDAKGNGAAPTNETSKAAKKQETETNSSSSPDEKTPAPRNPLPAFAPGAEKDLAWHKHDEIATGYLLDPSYEPCYSVRSGYETMERKTAAALAPSVEKEPAATIRNEAQLVGN